jgi:hypothetical protein
MEVTYLISGRSEFHIVGAATSKPLALKRVQEEEHEGGRSE